MLVGFRGDVGEEGEEGFSELEEVRLELKSSSEKRRVVGGGRCVEDSEEVSFIGSKAAYSGISAYSNAGAVNEGIVPSSVKV